MLKKRFGKKCPLNLNQTKLYESINIHKEKKVFLHYFKKEYINPFFKRFTLFSARNLLK